MPPTCSTKPARWASSRTCSISSKPPSGSPHATTLLASRAVSVSPRSSASCRARFPQSALAAHPSASTMFHANLAYAFASSRLAGSGSSTATASRAARPDSPVRPGHQRISQSRRQRASFPEPVAKGTTALERLLEGGYRLVALVGQVALVRTSLQHVGALAERQPGPGPEEAPVLGRGLAVGAHRAGSLRGGEGEADDSVGVPGRLGVVGQASEVQSVARPSGDGGQSLDGANELYWPGRPSSPG